MKRNIAGLILSGLMVVLLTACGESGAGAGAPPETITLEDGVTYTVIAEESDFDKMRDDLTGNYYLKRDIALTGDFEPIAPDTNANQFDFQGAPFTGIFEGNDKTISNLRIAKSSEDFVGLFGQIGTDGVVRNLTLVLVTETVNAPSVEGVNEVGALAGRSNGKIEAIGVEGGEVKGTGSNVGGLVGVTNGTITSSYATGAVKGASQVGGLVGYTNGTITSSYATGPVTGTSDLVGGLVGVASGGSSINSSYATGSVTLTGTGSNVGGLVGVASSGSSITSSYFDKSSTIKINNIPQSSPLGVGSGTLSGVTGYHTDDNNTPDLLSDDTVKNNGVAVTQSNFSTWDFNTVWRWVADGQWPLLAWQ